MMNRIRNLIFSSCLIASVLWPLAANGQPIEEAAAVQLHIEKATDLGGPWELVPPESMAWWADGSLVDIVEGPRGFYRLGIDAGESAGEALGIPLDAVPAEVKALAKNHLESLRVEEPDWAEAGLGPIVVPVFEPAVKGGLKPAYYEFKVVGLSPQPEPPDQPAFGLSMPLETSLERGYIIVTAGRHDVPVPQYATSGPTRCDYLRALAQETAARFVRYSAGFWVAEDADGELRASIGSTPYRIPADILQFKGPQPGAEILKGDQWQDSPTPAITPSAYQSYAEFRHDTIHGPLYTWLHQARARMAALSWAAIDEIQPPTIRIPVLEDTLVLPELEVASYELLDTVAAGWIEAKGGLWLNGSLDTTTEMIVIDTSGEVHPYVLVVGDPVVEHSWRAWNTAYALSNCAWIPRYTQVRDLPGCCSDGASGCGPTAWAIFYGFWDLRGVPLLIGGTGWTPYENNSEVNHCIQRTFALTGCWCTGIGGQAATNPWQMEDGFRYAAERGESISMSSNWCVPYTSFRPRRQARDAIVHANRPAIVGTGYFSHYPVAYAYRYRVYRAFGINWNTQVQWKVYQGWGGSGCEWVNANSCWFGMNAFCE